MPEVVDSKNFEELKSQGLVVNIDTTNLHQNYLLGQADSDEESIDNDHDYEMQNKTLINNTGLH